MEAQTVAFSVKEGGDYVVLTKKLHKDKKTVAVKPDTEEDNYDSQTESDEGTVETPDQDVQNDGENEQQAAAPESDGIAVSLYIRCDTLAADLSKLRDPSLESYVPADGVILALNEVNVTKGESVYDVLDRVCRDKGIHLEAVYTPNYGADYIEGINYLYEFDAGEQSGWMYTVNGVFPNYGCSDYILEDGDSIVWAYTCDMGKDLGK
ncbi:MAG: DUF4430 domain-containing protein [Firmicutes bacterium]|nr:DUF4430 domain-containing protein [Bacillota bacterium]